MKRHQDREAEDKEVLAAFMDEMAARLRKEAKADRAERRPQLTVIRGGKVGAIILGLLALPSRARDHWIAASAATAVAATAALGVTYAVTRPPERPPSIQAEEPDGLPVAPEVQVESHPTHAPRSAAATSTPPPPAERVTPPAVSVVPTSPAAVTPRPTDIGSWPTSPPPASAAPTPTTESAPVTEVPDPAFDMGTPSPTPTPEPTTDPPSTPGPDPGAGEKPPYVPPIFPPPGLCVRLPGVHLCVVLPLGVGESTVE